MNTLDVQVDDLVEIITASHQIILYLKPGLYRTAVCACAGVCACVYTMERPVLLVQVARQRVSVPLRRLEHAFLLGGGELLAVFPEVATLASLPAGDSWRQAFNILHQLHVAPWWRRGEEEQTVRKGATDGAAGGRKSRG